MMHVYFYRFISLLISFSLLVAPLPLSALAQQISSRETAIVERNADSSYVPTKGELKKLLSRLLAHKQIMHLPESLDIFDQDLPMNPNSFTRDLVVQPAALVVATSDIGSPPSGLQTIDGVTLMANNRVLLVGQTNQVENGLWLAASGSWTRPTDFDTGNMADQAYVFISSGTADAGTSWRLDAARSW